MTDVDGQESLMEQGLLQLLKTTNPAGIVRYMI